MPSQMQFLSCLLLCLLLAALPFIGGAQLNECPHQETTLSTPEPLTKIVFGDTSAVGITVSGNSGVTMDYPTDAVNGFVASTIADSSVYCLFRARHDQSFGGAFLAKVGLDGSTAMEWGHTYGIRTGLPLFLAQDVIVRDSVVSILGFFPLYDDNGNPPSQFDVVIGSIESYTGRVDIDINDGSLITTTILADSTVFEGPDLQMSATFAFDGVDYYRQHFLNEGFALTRERYSTTLGGSGVDTVYINTASNMTVSPSTRTTGAVNKIVTIKDQLYYLDVLLNPLGNSYARILHFDEALHLVDSVDLGGVDLASTSFLGIYASGGDYLKVTVSHSDAAFDETQVRLYTPGLDFSESTDVTAIMEDDLETGPQRLHRIWPYEIEGTFIFTASDFSDVGDGLQKRFNWYQLDDNFEPQLIVEDVVSPGGFVLINQSFIELPNNQVGLIMRSQCKTEVTNRGSFYELWIYDESDIASYLSPVSTDDPPAITSHEQLLVYPNPAQDRLFVGSHEASLFDIFSSYGKIVRSAEVSTDGYIDIVSLPAGVYTVRSRQDASYARFVKVE